MKLTQVYQESTGPVSIAGDSQNRVIKVTAYEGEEYTTPSLIKIESGYHRAEDFEKTNWRILDIKGPALIRKAIEIYDQEFEWLKSSGEVPGAAGYAVNTFKGEN